MTAFLILFALALVHAGAGVGDTLQIKSEVYVKGPKLRVGDVAEIKGDNMEEIAALEIGFAALPGRTKRVQAALIESRLQREGYSCDAVEVTGARTVSATTMHLEITSGMLEESLREFVETEMPWDPLNATVDLVVPTFDIVVPDGEVAFLWRPSPQYRYLGRGAFRGEIKVDGLTQKTVICRAAIESFGEIVVAAHDIPRGQIINHDDLDVQVCALSTVDRNAFSDPADVVGLVAKRTIFPDQILTKRQVTPRRLVKRNQAVLVEVRSSTLVVRAQARALADGCEGDIVPCINVDSEEEFLGIVRKDGVVVVE